MPTDRPLTPEQFVARFAEWWTQAGHHFYSEDCRDHDGGLCELAHDAQVIVATLERNAKQDVK